MTTYRLTMRVYEMGEDTFIEEEHESLAEAQCSAMCHVSAECITDEHCDEWHVVDLTGADPECMLEVQWTTTEGDESFDYIMQIVREEY